MDLRSNIPPVEAVRGVHPLSRHGIGFGDHLAVLAAAAPDCGLPGGDHRIDPPGDGHVLSNDYLLRLGPGRAAASPACFGRPLPASLPSGPAAPLPRCWILLLRSRAVG